MKLIPQQRIDDDGSKKDIFAYFRSHYSSTNLSKDGIVSIIASSTTWATDYQKTGPTNLISATDDLRWCSSSADKNPKFEIKFHSNYVTLLSYTIENFKNHRYIKSWKVFGISKRKKYLFDSRINETILGEATSSSIFAPFTCQHIGTFNTYSIELAGGDSNNENLLSMSSIQFYGIVNPYNYKQTCYIIRKTHSTLALIINALLMSS